MFKVLLLAGLLGTVVAATAFAAGTLGSSSSPPDQQNRGASTPDAGHRVDHRIMRGREDSDFDTDATVGRDPK